MTGPRHGRADLYVDGSLRGTYNNYSKHPRFGVERSLTGLGSGQHTVEVRAIRKKGARIGTGTLVAVDGFVTAGAAIASPVLTQSWQRAGNANRYYVVADLAGQTATLPFRGTSVTLHTAAGPRFGEAALYVDGALAKSVNLYAATLAFGEQVTVTGLSDARHTLQVRVLGASASAPAGTGVVIDQIGVG